MNMKTNFQSLATRLITKVFGSIAQQVTIRRPVYNTYDELSGSLISGSEDYTVIGIVGPWKKDNQSAQSSDAIQTTDLALLISKTTLDITPELNFDIAITADQTQWNIIYSETDPAEATVLFRLSKEIEQ